MFQALIRWVVVASIAVAVAGCDTSRDKAANDKPNDAAPPKGEKQAPATAEPQAAAGAQTSTDANMWVMQARGNRQCEGGGRSLQASSAQLVENGIKVQESRCATRTDRMYPSVCGGATGDVLIHKIPAGFLDAALELGFDPAKPGQYQLGDCPQETPGGAASR
ncbi:hypothetical protein KUV95_05960 [Microbulbifer agarilyticus]|uniref:hypothetical protein n=1 Tax=Microbulbifer agarilyticus TaxID=260552 RepID=UPI001C93F594|nr:hypothetical protein [Microbulbifer agarilyticus]MBY6211089.1 hypothetical protein [Microbulbifer agarilyticus]